MSERDAIHKAFEQAAQMRYSAARLAVLEEAIRVADTSELEEYAFVARMKAVQSAIFGGFPEKAMVYFSWCVARHEAEPERFPEQSSYISGVPYWFTDLIWGHKWINQNLRGFYQITRSQIEDARQKFAEALKRNGFNLRPYWMEVARSAWVMDGDLESARRAYSKFELLGRDRYADCAACEQNFGVELSLWAEALDQALERARPLTDLDMSCAEVPHITYADLMLPAFFDGRTEEARHFHRLGYPMVEAGRDFLSQIADHLEFVVRDGDPAKALEIFDHHVAFATDTMQPMRRMHFWRASSLLFDRVERDRIRARIPKDFAVYREEGRYVPERLSTFFRDEAISIASKFDSRNGNTVISDRLKSTLDR